MRKLCGGMREDDLRGGRRGWSKHFSLRESAEEGAP